MVSDVVRLSFMCTSVDCLMDYLCIFGTFNCLTFRLFLNSHSGSLNFCSIFILPFLLTDNEFFYHVDLCEYKLSMIVKLDTAEHFIFAAFYYCVSLLLRKVYALLLLITVFKLLMTNYLLT